MDFAAVEGRVRKDGDMSSTERLMLQISDEDSAAEGLSAAFIEDGAREIDGVLKVERRKPNADTMDLGNIVEIVFTSGATIALAQGLAGWLKARRGAKVIVEKTQDAASIKTIVSGIDPATAERIVERHIT
jgi:hypothetical protein